MCWSHRLLNGRRILRLAIHQPQGHSRNEHVSESASLILWRQPRARLLLVADAILEDARYLRLPTGKFHVQSLTDGYTDVRRKLSGSSIARRIRRNNFRNVAINAC